MDNLAILKGFMWHYNATLAYEKLCCSQPAEHVYDYHVYQMKLLDQKAKG